MLADHLEIFIRTTRTQWGGERRGDVTANHIHSSRQEGWGGQPLIHRYHGFLTGGGGSDWEGKHGIFVDCPTDNRTPFQNLRLGQRGSASLFAPNGRSWDPGYTLTCVGEFPFVNRWRWPTRRSAPSKWCAVLGPWTAPRWPEATDTFPSFKGTRLLLSG